MFRIGDGGAAGRLYIAVHNTRHISSPLWTSCELLLYPASDGRGRVDYEMLRNRSAAIAARQKATIARKNEAKGGGAQ